MFLSGDIGIIEEENECEKSDANPILVKNVQSRNKVKSQDLDFLEHASQQVQNFRENGIRYTHSIFPSFPYQLLRIVSDILNNFCPGTHERRKVIRFH